MIMPLIGGSLGAVNLITSQTVINTTPITSAWIDLSLYEGNALIILNSGAASAGDTLTITLQESVLPSGSGTAVPAVALFNPATGENASFAIVTDAGASFQTLSLNLEHLARYVRVTATASGTSISIPFSVALVAPQKYVG